MERRDFMQMEFPANRPTCPVKLSPGRRLRRRQTRQTQKGFTLIELLVVIAIIVLLVSILVPSLTRARALARNVVCKTTLRSIGMTVLLYRDEHNMTYPAMHVGYAQGNLSYYWYNLLAPYAGGECKSDDWLMESKYPGLVPRLFAGCPDYPEEKKYETPWETGYGMAWGWQYFYPSAYWTWRRNFADYDSAGALIPPSNGVNGFLKLGEFRRPEVRGFLGDANHRYLPGGVPTQTADDPTMDIYPYWPLPQSWGKQLADPMRHLGDSDSGQANYLMADMHVESLEYDVSGFAFSDTSKLPG